MERFSMMMDVPPRKRLRNTDRVRNNQNESQGVPTSILSQPTLSSIPLRVPQSQPTLGGEDAVDINLEVGDTTPEQTPKPRNHSRLSRRPRVPKREDELLLLPVPLVSRPPSSEVPQQLQVPRSQLHTQVAVEDRPRETEVKKEEEEYNGIIGSSSSPQMQGEGRSKVTTAPGNSTAAEEESYHVLSFKHVMREAIEFHSHVLCSSDLNIARKFLDDNVLSPGAVYLFTRVYRRKHDQWLQEKGLVEKYEAEMPKGADVSTAAAELVRSDLFSSVWAADSGSEYERALELLGTLSLIEIKEVFKLVPGARAVKNASKKIIIPVLQKLLNGPPRSLQVRPSSKRVQEDKNQIQSQLTPHRSCQMPILSQVFSPGRSQVFTQGTEFKIQGTLTNIPPATRIAKKILSKVGNSVRIPTTVLAALERMHFVVLLEEQAHASPSLVLSFTGLLRFPSYTCVHKTLVFPSKEALNAFQKARDLERELDEAVDPKVKDWWKARDLGADAEAEVRNFLYPSTDPESVASRSDCSFEGAIHGSQKQSFEETRQQLQHPFFRRYTSHWVYVRAAWHSVAALESLGEYETAAKRLELLLETICCRNDEEKF